MKSLPQKDLYAKIFNSALVAIGTTDTKGNFIAVNPALVKRWAGRKKKLIPLILKI